jgi:glycosyltransferase involved in cell wall biosynthesis
MPRDGQLKENGMDPQYRNDLSRATAGDDSSAQLDRDLTTARPEQAAWPSEIGSKAGFSVNASRIGNTGGLRTFTDAILSCLNQKFSDVDVVLPRGIAVPESMKVIELPNWLGSSSGISRFRPLLWLAYSAFLFPIRRSRRVLSTTHHVLPFRRHQVVTVHDLRPYFEPDTWLQKVYFHVLLPGALRKCDGILTVSKTSKEALISVYGIDAQKIHLVPNPVVQPVSNLLNEIAEKKKLEDPYLLMIGASWKHKNVIEFLGFHDLWQSKYRLKILAGAGKYRDYLRAQVAKLKLASRVDFPVQATNTQLEELYRGCVALVYPSRMEGFGIPPLEAMAYGKPAIVSDIPVFRELYGDVPIYVKLGNSASWEGALAELDASRQIVNEWRKQAGIDLARSFSQENTCRALTLALEIIWKIELH